jgi:hypothetical protein
MDTEIAAKCVVEVGNRVMWMGGGYSDQRGVVLALYGERAIVVDVGGNHWYVYVADLTVVEQEEQKMG